MRTLCVALCAWLTGAALAAETDAPPTFTAKPTATALPGGKAKIEFAVSKATDVAVYIETADGRVVRHLVAGALGSNPPPPLKPNALSQSIEWDGTDDDGRKAEGRPFATAKPGEAGFRVRVGLGLRASWGGTAFSQHGGPAQLGTVQGLAVAGDGRLYVMNNRSGWLYWPSSAVSVFRRDGSYEKTIKPFASNTPPDKIAPTKAFINDRGLLNPIIFRALGMTFYPFEDSAARQMAVVDGKLYLTVVPSAAAGSPTYRGEAPHLAAIGPDGETVLPNYAGPALGPWRYILPRLAAASDGKSLFVAGFGTQVKPWNEPVELQPFVARAKLPDGGPAEVFFGDVKQSGDDATHLKNPRGLASDGRGHLLVCDYGNHRVAAIRESDGRFAGSMPTSAPEWVGVHPKTGAVYVHSGDDVIKFSGWQTPKELARLSLKKFTTVYAGWGNARLLLSFALDASAEPAVLWVGRGGVQVDPPLLRCDDLGEKFSEPAAVGVSAPLQWRPASDPTHRLVACRVEEIDRRKATALHVLDDATGQTARVVCQPQAAGNGQGQTHRLDRDGNIYVSQAEGGIWKCDPKGKRIPFTATADDPKLKGHIPGGSTGTTAWERDWYVDRKGDIYAKVRGTSYHGLMHVDVFAPDGAKKRTALWGVTDGAYGPRVDARGNLYLMECIKPLGQPFPEDLAARLPDKAVRHWYDWIYGSIVKFPPAGGNLFLTTGRKDDQPRAEPVALPATVEKKRIHATFRGGENFVQGAEWMTPGVAHVGDMGVAGGGDHCHCTGCDFDLDDFGRSFAPDNGRQRVTVLDANGNVLAHFGGYGNQDSCGPDSYVIDAADKRLRPRRPDDPKDLVSPFAQPEVAFNWIVGLAVTDRHAYVTDCANRRTLRVKLDYAASETAAIP